MNIEELRLYCLGKPFAVECFPFDETTLVFKVMNKMFAMIDLEHPDVVSLKCDPDYAIELRDRYDDITGAWHMNKKYWNQVNLQGDVPHSLLLSLIDHSYDEVVKKLPKKIQKALL